MDSTTDAMSPFRARRASAAKSEGRLTRAPFAARSLRVAATPRVMAEVTPEPPGAAIERLLSLDPVPIVELASVSSRSGLGSSETRARAWPRLVASFCWHEYSSSAAEEPPWAFQSSQVQCSSFVAQHSSLPFASQGSSTSLRFLSFSCSHYGAYGGHFLSPGNRVSGMLCCRASTRPSRVYESCLLQPFSQLERTLFS